MELQAVVEIMGGQDTIGKKVHNTADIIELSVTGMSSKVIRAVQARGHFSNKEISEFLNISPSTYQRYRTSKKKLKRDESEKIFHLSSVIAKGIDVFGEEDKFIQWLHLDNAALGGRKPITWLSSQIGREEILNVLGRLEHGIFS